MSFEQFNESGDKPYKLSASMGSAVLDLKRDTMDSFLNEIDKKMCG